MESKIYKVTLKKEVTNTFSSKNLFDFITTKQSYLKNPESFEINVALLDSSL